MANKWTNDELEILKRYDGCNSLNQVIDEIKNNINRSSVAIKAKFFEIGCKTKRSKWTKNETEKLIALHASMSNEDIAKQMNRSVISIQNKAGQLKLHKDNTYKRRREHNYFIEEDTYYKMYTHDMKYYCIIDKDDYEKVKEHYWYMTYEGYFATSVRKNNSTFLHKYIIIGESNKDIIIDHINQKRYDNRKNNLRISNSKENTHNRGISDGILRIQDNLFRCYYPCQRKKILHEGTYSECRKKVIEQKNINLQIIQEQAMYQIPGLFELLSEEDKKRCFENLQQKYEEEL